MTRFGYTLMTEQSGPKDLVRYAISAERVGFDFEVSSDHYSPWLAAQGHSPNAWTVLGAVAHATDHVELFSYVTCPTMRYHPAIVAQQAATLQILADGRFTLGLGSGENLNEHVVGKGWPTVQRRHGMLREADGSVVESDRFMVAICACRRSKSYPLCDTSHRRRCRNDEAVRPAVGVAMSGRPSSSPSGARRAGPRRCRVP